MSKGQKNEIERLNEKEGRDFQIKIEKLFMDEWEGFVVPEEIFLFLLAGAAKVMSIEAYVTFGFAVACSEGMGRKLTEKEIEDKLDSFIEKLKRVTEEQEQILAKKEVKARVKIEKTEMPAKHVVAVTNPNQVYIHKGKKTGRNYIVDGYNSDMTALTIGLNGLVNLVNFNPYNKKRKPASLVPTRYETIRGGDVFLLEVRWKDNLDAYCILDNKRGAYRLVNGQVVRVLGLEMDSIVYKVDFLP